MKKHSLLITAIGLITLSSSNAQVLTNDGAAIFASPGALIFVDGEMVNQGLGTYDNSGAIELTGDWTNNAGNAAFINGSPGSVTMSGGIQNIKGTDPTLFYDLILSGTGNKAQQVNTTVTDSLALNDKELATDTFLMHVTNTSLTAITRTTGFVSSIDTGGLARDMASAATYLFPVGSSVGVTRYRPVELTPTVATAHTYKVRMANVDATTEGYDRSINDSTFCVINPDYYHTINQTIGTSPADITIYYDDALDNAYQTITHWQNAPRWEDIGPATNVLNVSPALSYLTVTAWNDYALPAFALATTSPTVALSANDTSICQGDTLLFTASSGFTNYEFFNNGLSVQNGALNTYQVTGATTGDTIKVTATDLGCTAFSNQLIITVNPVPVIDVTAMVITDDNCGGGVGSIIGITAIGSAPLSYQWLDATLALVGGDSANVMNLPPEDYTLTVTDNNGCSATSGAHTVTGGLTPILDISAMVIAPPTCGNLTGSITGITVSGGSGPLTFDWVDGLSATVGTAVDLTGVGPDSYTFTVTDSVGCIGSTGPHVLTDQPGPVLDTTGFVIGTSTCGLSDGAITGISVSGGTGTLTFDWSNSVPISVATTIDLTLSPAGSYTLTVTDSNGCTNASGPHAINDAGAPVINISAINIDSSRCDLATGAITGITVTGGVAPLTLVWNDPGLQSTLDAVGLDCNTYSFLVTDASGCVSTSGPHIVPCFSAPTAPVAASPPAFCVGDPISDLTATGTGVIKWYSDILLNDSIGTGSPFTSGATSDTAYWVAGTSNGCVGASTQVDIVINSTPPAPFAGNDTAICFGAVVNVTLNVTGGSGTEWWLDAGLTIPLDTGNLLTIPPSIGVNIYYVTQSNGSCRGPYDSVIVTMDAPVTASIAGNDTICEGNPTTLTASGGTTYLWSTTETSAAISVSPTVTTTYNVIVGDGACSATVSHTVNIESLPVANITITGGSANLCGGESLTLSSDPADTYSWDTSPGSTTQVITFTPPAGINSVYTLTVTNSCGSDNTSLPVTVEALLDAGPDLDLCKNTDIVGFAATGSATPPGGTWSSPDPVIFPGNLQPNGFIDHIAIPWGSGYELVYTSASGQCADTLLLEVTGAEAGADTTVCTGASSFFLSNPSPAGGTWSSPDINAANNLDGTTGEVLLEGLAGPYVFVYETLGLTGKSCPDSVVVKICGSNDVWIPNIFSPNGDSENDIMFVRGIALDWVQILIYDRWGEQVYDSGKGTMALDEGWDGTYKGKELTPQVFVYYLNGAYLDGEVIEMKKGNITLVK